jgi:polyhydroxyalkanoate synthesis regulator phasin
VFSVEAVGAASANPLVTGGIFVLCAAIAMLICRKVYKRHKAAHNNGSDKKWRSNEKGTGSVRSEATLLTQLQTTTDHCLDPGAMENGKDVEFADEEATKPPKGMGSNSSEANDIETMSQNYVDEINRLETAAEQEAAKAAGLAAKLEELEHEAVPKASDFVEMAQDKEALQTKVAELIEELGRLQDNSKSSTGAASEDNDIQLPMPPPQHDNRPSTVIPNELLKGLLGDSSVAGCKKGDALSDDDPRARVMKAGNSVGGAGNVRVAVRVRPPNQRELAGEGNGVCVDVVPADGIVKVGSDRAFTFDVAFSMEATQAQVFDTIGVDLVGWVLGGYNASVFAYGQTSSGKTHSMMGARNSEVLKGLIPRIISLLWECTRAFLDENSKHDCVLKASYLEVYNEEIRDLLGNYDKLKLRSDPKKGTFASGLTMVLLRNGEEAMKCIERGAQLRSVAATNFNSESSRSHAVFELHISKTYPTDSGDMVSTSRLSLTDLAGSERSSKVGTSGMSLQEGNNINKSLSTLGRCITALVDISQGKKALAPFRDSVLTLYLREALVGNVLTTMLANVSPVNSNMEETVSTLRFAASAKRIKTKVTKNEDSQQKRIRELTEELEAIKKELTVQTRLAEGAKNLVKHLKGETLAAASPEDQHLKEKILAASPEGQDVMLEAQETAASTVRQFIANRRGSMRDAAFSDTVDQAAGMASKLAASDESSSVLMSSGEDLPSTDSLKQLPKRPPQPRPNRLAARKAASIGKQSQGVTL